MKPTPKLVTVAGCATLLTALAACGTSHNESNAQVCAKIKADAQSLQSDNPGSNLKAAGADIKNVVKKLNSDASHAKSSALRDGVSKATAAFTAVANDLSSSTLPAGSKLTQIQSQLNSAQAELKGQCPQFSGSTTGSTG